MTHGRMVSGAGSNVYVQNPCQQSSPLAYDFVAEHRVVDGERIERGGELETSCSGHRAVSNPEIGDLLPVCAYEDYPGRSRPFSPSRTCSSRATLSGTSRRCEWCSRRRASVAARSAVLESWCSSIVT